MTVASADYVSLNYKGEMIMKKRNLFVRISAVLITLALIAAMALCMTSCGEKDASSSTPKSQSGAVTESKTEFKFTVKYQDGKEESFDIKTDKKTVGEALLDEGLISGSDSEYGLLVDTVNGVRADYTKDKAYWAFFINGEYANTGVSSTDIEAGAEYSFVYTPA